MTKLKSGKGSYVVILGSNTIKAYVTAPKEFTAIGIIQVGMEYGLLCTTEGGTFVRVNGSIIQNLEQAQVKIAITKAIAKGRSSGFQGSDIGSAMAKLVPAPNVVVRRRRTIDPSIASVHQGHPTLRSPGAAIVLTRAPAERGILEFC